MDSYSSNNKRIAKNTLLLYFRMLILMLVSLYTSRVVLDALGVENFGIYNVVSSVVAVIGFISGPMIESTQRYLNFYMGKGNGERVKDVFNACQIIHFVFAVLILFVGEIVGKWFVNNYLVIPSERMEVAVWIFHLSIVASVFLVMSFPYNAVIIAHEKMSVFAWFSILEALAKLTMAYLLYVSPFDKLIFYATLLAAIQIVVSLSYRMYCVFNFDEVKLKIKGIDLDLYKQILSFSGWNFLGNLASQCLTQGTSILLNMFFGPVVNAAKAISVQIQNAVFVLSNNFMMAVKPQIVKNYAAGEMEYMHKLIFISSRVSFYLVLFVALPVFFKTEWLLSLWLKKVPEYAADFTKFTMMFALVQSLAVPLFSGSVATGNVKRIMSVIATFFVMVIPITYVALRLGGAPLIVFEIQLAMYIVAHLMRIVIVGKQLGFSVTNYIYGVLLRVIVVLFLSLFAMYAVDLVFPDGFLYNVFFVALSIVFTAGICTVFGITHGEQKMIISFLRKKLCQKN